MTSAELVQLLLALLGSSGVIGAIIALLKLRPEADSSAVRDSKNALDMMVTINKHLEEERDYWRQRALAAEAQTGGHQ